MAQMVALRSELGGLGSVAWPGLNAVGSVANLAPVANLESRTFPQE